MNELPKLSVVVPSYNQAQFIGRTLQSIVDQNYPNLEVIVLDGGSTDGSVEIIESYRQYIAHFETGPDGGQAAAIRKGFALATGEFISWLNSDDTYNPGALLTIGKSLQANPKIRFIYGNIYLIDADDNKIAYKKSIKAVLGVIKYAFLTVPQMSAYWSRELYCEVGGMDSQLRFCMDYDLFVRMAERSLPVKIDADIGNFRLHGDAKTSTLEHVRQQEDKIVHTRYCRIKPENQIAFAFARKFWTAVLILLFIENGSFWSRAQRRLGNRGQSECS